MDEIKLVVFSMSLSTKPNYEVNKKNEVFMVIDTCFFFFLKMWTINFGPWYLDEYLCCCIHCMLRAAKNLKVDGFRYVTMHIHATARSRSYSCDCPSLKNIIRIPYAQGTLVQPSFLSPSTSHILFGRLVLNHPHPLVHLFILSNRLGKHPVFYSRHLSSSSLRSCLSLEGFECQEQGSLTAGSPAVGWANTTFQPKK